MNKSEIHHLAVISGTLRNFCKFAPPFDADYLTKARDARAQMILLKAATALDKLRAKMAREQERLDRHRGR